MEADRADPQGQQRRHDWPQRGSERVPPTRCVQLAQRPDAAA